MGMKVLQVSVSWGGQQTISINKGVPFLPELHRHLSNFDSGSIITLLSYW